jgi:hypothetical protein
MEVERGAGKGKKKNYRSKWAKKNNKKAKFAKGTHLNEEIYPYFLQILDFVESKKFRTEAGKGITYNQT